ncbi:hypothetical protein SAMN04488109_0461 [Chryseolinea serpens]|uniref:MORN repeat variant n=1 Tax=Chryseolinea serpens TaxID=947013 RepID=A0A1M5K7H9_9BACT|nr:hypothetical protein [Chryseolinea serpens]SHG48163.1 hypothetical protein SAMN04488109_0461 [Chryseolinea serpens]
MNRFFIPLVALILYTSAKAQDSELPKQYFDKDWTPLTGSEGATYYRTLEKKESLTVVRDYYISGKIETVSEQKFNGKKMVRDGKTV